MWADSQIFLEEVISIKRKEKVSPVTYFFKKMLLKGKLIFLPLDFDA